MNFSNVKHPLSNDQFVIGFLISLIIIYPILFIWQCGDLTDTGYFALNYQHFFTNLSNGKTNSVSFLSDLIGATWFKIFPALGIIGLKFLYLLFLYAIVCISYQVLKSLNYSKKIILLSLLIGVICSERWTMFVFSRDVSSWLFLLISGFFLLNGLQNKKNQFLIISGALFTLACLARLPNLIFLFLLPLILFYKIYYIDKDAEINKIEVLVKRYAFFLIGFSTLLLLLFLLFSSLGITNTYVSNLDVVKNSFDSNQQSWYSITYLLARYRNDIILFIPHFLTIFALLILLTWMYTISVEKKKYIVLVLSISIIAVISFSIYKGHSCSNNVRYLIPGFFIPVFLATIVYKKEKSMPILVISVITLTQVFGSNTGLFMKLNFSLILLLPLTILLFLDQPQISFKNKKYTTSFTLYFGIATILFFNIYSRIGWIFPSQSDISIRIKATHPIAHPLLKGTFTTKENASHIENVCEAINRAFDKNNSLLIYGHQPLFYYLTNHQPEVERCWFDKFHTAEDFIKSVKKSILKTGKWPLIVDVKEKVIGEHGELILANYLQKNNYLPVEEGIKYTVWKKQMD